MRKLKQYSGMAFLKGKQERFYVGATSAKHLIELMNSIGVFGLNNKYISDYWNKSWGNTMNEIELTEPCVYMNNKSEKNLIRLL